MLSSFRSNASNPFVWLPVGIIVFVFVFTFGSWGGGDISGNVPMAAIVNGRVLPEAQFSAAYSRAFQGQQMFRRGYGFEEAKGENLKGKVLDELIDRELLAQAAEDRGMRVGDEELVDYIKQQFFGPDRPFDREEYKRLVNGYFQTTEPRFEEQVRREILAARMEKLISEAVSVSPAELQTEFDARFNRADLEFLRIDPNFFKDVETPSKTLVAAWVETHGTDIEAHYNEHINRYRTSKQVKARHILAKVEKDADDAAKAAARAKIEGAQKRIQGGEDFATVAKEVSEDVGTKDKGGDLGLFGSGRMVPAFEKAAFALKAGETSEIVETRFGFHVIRVEEVKEAEVKELADVRDEIAEKIMLENARGDKAKELANQAIANLKAGKVWSELNIDGLKLPPKEGEEPSLSKDPYAPRVESTGFFAMNARYVPRIGVSKEVVSAAFALSAEQPVAETAYEVSGRYYVLRLKDREAPAPDKFDSEKDSIEQSLLRTRKSAVRKSFLDKARDKATIQRNPKVTSYAS